MNTKRKLIEAANEMGIEVVKAKNPKDSRRIGIHLLNPTVQELGNALESAEKDLFPAIVIHNSKTWPQAKAA